MCFRFTRRHDLQLRTRAAQTYRNASQSVPVYSFFSRGVPVRPAGLQISAQSSLSSQHPVRRPADAQSTPALAPRPVACLSLLLFVVAFPVVLVFGVVSCSVRCVASGNTISFFFFFFFFVHAR